MRPTIRTSHLPYALAALALLLALFVFLSHGPARAAGWDTKGGVAIGGYDPVAYFTQKKPMRGSARFAHQWKGAKWYFVSAGNRDAFKSNPAKYAPQYGGFCALGMSMGLKVPTNPAAWTVHKGKLYLNSSIGSRSTWRKNIPGRIKAANQSWKTK